MSYTNYATGEIYIEPPLLLSEMDSIDVEQYVQGECTAPWYRGRTRERDLSLYVDLEASVPSAEYVSVRREDRNDFLAADLQRLVERYGRDHRFVGYLEVEPESGDGNFPYRVQVLGGKAQDVHPIITWPEED